MSDQSYDCRECGMRVSSAREFHPYLFCVLRRAGYLDPAGMLAQYGYTRTEVPS